MKKTTKLESFFLMSQDWKHPEKMKMYFELWYRINGDKSTKQLI